MDKVVTQSARKRRPRRVASPSSEKLTSAQIELARIVAQRHEMTLPIGFESDPIWTRRFLDVFAFDPDTEIDVFRRVRNVAAWCREERTVDEIARKVDLKPSAVRFMIEVMADSGIDLDPHEVSLVDG